MDRRTVAVYEQSATEFAERRRAADPARARAFAARVAVGGVRLDLGCGPGFDVADLGTPIVAADAAPAMVAEARRRHPGTPGVVCDLAALPLRRGALAGVWASRSLQHIAREDVPLALAGIHRALAVGGTLEATLFSGEGGPDKRSEDEDFPGRWFAWWPEGPLRDVLVGAGFDVEQIGAPDGSPDQMAARAVRARTLPDTVGPRMRLLMCGLNPSLYAADAGVGFARPGNRYWPALRAAGLVADSAVRSPDRALARPRHRHDRRREAGDGGRGRADGGRVPRPAWAGSSAWSRGCARARSASSAWPAGGRRSTAGRPRASNREAWPASRST